MSSSMDGINSVYLGAMCSEFRRYHLPKVTQTDIAVDCGVSRESVSKFERGANSNAVIFMWYIKQGLFEWVPIERWCGFKGYLGE